jgi:hypothetical protein
MAEKSGQIDATLRLGGLSEVFTQDLEDMVGQAEIMPQKPPQAVPEASEADLTTLLEASIEQVKVNRKNRPKVEMERDPDVPLTTKVTAIDMGLDAYVDRDAALGDAHEALAKLEVQTCHECNGELGAYVSKAGTPFIQCSFARGLFLEWLDKGKTKAMASAMTKDHYYQVVP